jgi:tRNA pseudouridine55 synthase
VSESNQQTQQPPVADPGEVILIDKPLTWTSFDVANKLKRACKFKKIGHAGTLDPLATGLLILCTGKKTKQIDTYQAQEKEYTGTFVLGKTTPSVDLETDFDGEYPIDHILSGDFVDKAVASLTGELDQKPPVYSAVRVDGERLYKKARRGEQVEVKTRKVTIKAFEVDTARFPEVDFRVVCSKGTYIRSLVKDFGELVESGAYLKALRRTRIGEFSVDNAWELEAFIRTKREELGLDNE